MLPRGRHVAGSGRPAVVYKECLRNHAASLGGHAVDGCGEFMPSPLYTPSDPTSLKCAACGCHRNFHRCDTDDDDDEDEEQEAPRPLFPNPNSSSPLTLSAPHMLLALSAAAAAGEEGNGPISPAAVARKRFRTKFSGEQKEKMLALSERLGWRLRRQDEADVEESCRQIGVGRDVFKVWMHNNKSNFVKRVDGIVRDEAANGAGACASVGTVAGAGAGACAGAGAVHSNGGTTHLMNVSSSS